MENSTVKIINNEYWEIIKMTSLKSFFVVNTHRQDGEISGSTQPDFIKEFANRSEAIAFLEQRFNESVS